MSAFRNIRGNSSAAPLVFCLKNVGTVSTQLEPDSFDKKILTARLLITPFQLGLRGKGGGERFHKLQEGIDVT